MAITFDVIAAGAQGAIVWHPDGAQGKWQGSWSCAGAPGAAGAGAGARPMSMWAITEAPLSLMPPISGITHNTPLPRSTDWSMTNTAAIADKRRGRLMEGKVAPRLNRRKRQPPDIRVVIVLTRGTLHREQRLMVMREAIAVPSR